MNITNRVLSPTSRSGLLKGELPALALGAVGTAVLAGAGDEEARIRLYVDPGARYPLCDVLEMFRRFGGDAVYTLWSEIGRASCRERV